MSLLPQSTRERVLYALVVVLVVVIVVMAISSKVQSSDDPREVVSLEVCLSNLESAELFRDHYKAERDEERKLYKDTLASREKLWESIYARVKQQKAGVECWSENEALRTQIEEEKKFYYWSLKFCGAIRDKTDGQVKRYEKKVQDLVEDMSEDELEKMLD